MLATTLLVLCLAGEAPSPTRPEAATEEPGALESLLEDAFVPGTVALGGLGTLGVASAVMVGVSSLVVAGVALAAAVATAAGVSLTAFAVYEVCAILLTLFVVVAFLLIMGLMSLWFGTYLLIGSGLWRVLPLLSLS